VYCELYGLITHISNKYHALHALADRIDFSTFWIDESSQRLVGGSKGRSDFRGGSARGI